MADPVKPIRLAALSLAGAETATSALTWFDLPVMELYQWIDAVVEKQEQDERKRGK